MHLDQSLPRLVMTVYHQCILYTGTLLWKESKVIVCCTVSLSVEAGPMDLWDSLDHFTIFFQPLYLFAACLASGRCVCSLKSTKAKQQSEIKCGQIHHQHYHWNSTSVGSEPSPIQHLLVTDMQLVTMWPLSYLGYCCCYNWNYHHCDLIPIIHYVIKVKQLSIIVCQAVQWDML